MHRTYTPIPCLDCQVFFTPTGGKAKRCPSCQAVFARSRHRQYEKERRAKNPDRARAWSRANKDRVELRRQVLRYGLTEEQVLAEREKDCEICGKPSKHFDHDHETGRYRGRLCQSCNTGLGKLGDSVEGLQRAIQYLCRP